MKNLWINENWVNRTENSSCGESEPYETFTDNVGELFRSLQKEHGKCVSVMYVDLKSGESIKAGWVFQKKKQYDDCEDFYIAETWITVYKSQPIKKVEYEIEYAF